MLHCWLLCRTSCVGTLLFAILFFVFFSDAQSSVRKASATCLLLAWLMVEVGALEMVARFGDEDVVGRGGLVDGGRAAAGDFVVMRYASFALVGGGWVRQRSGLKRGV